MIRTIDIFIYIYIYIFLVEKHSKMNQNSLLPKSIGSHFDCMKRIHIYVLLSHKMSFITSNEYGSESFGNSNNTRYSTIAIDLLCVCVGARARVTFSRYNWIELASSIRSFFLNLNYLQATNILFHAEIGFENEMDRFIVICFQFGVAAAGASVCHIPFLPVVFRFGNTCDDAHVKLATGSMKEK